MDIIKLLRNVFKLISIINLVQAIVIFRENV